jgi:hypothetical protein
MNGSADKDAAKRAAEYGFSALVSKLNKNDKAYLLVTNFTSWNSITQADLSSCDIYASTTPSSTSDALAGVSTNTRGTKSEPVGGSLTQSYTLTDYTPPSFAGANINYASGICDNSTSALKFANLLGGSGTLTVTGNVIRNGRVTSTYVLKGAVHVKFPNQALSNPIALLGDGSKLQGLNGRICQTANPPATINTTNPCSGLQPTPVACADLEDCLYYNVDTPKYARNKYCTKSPYNTYKAGRRYKRNIPCNTFQQLGGMPDFPGLGNLNFPGQTSAGQPVYTDSRPTGYVAANGSTGQKIVSIELSCVDTTTKSYSFFSYIGCTAYRYAYASDGKLALKESSGVQEDFSNFPYITSLSDTDFDNITDKAGLSKLTLNSGCYPNTGSIQTATAINCVFGKFTDSTPDRASFKTYKADLKVWHTDIIPVNIWIIGQNSGPNPTLDLDNSSSQGGIYNADESYDSWKNLKIFGYNSSSNVYLDDNIPDGNNDCTKQSVKLGKSGRRRSYPSRYYNKYDTEGIIDGAFMWFPNANIEIKDLQAKTTPYLVTWACKLTGPKTTSSAIFTPISHLGVNAGISGVFNITGGTLGINTYRAFGSKEITTNGN